jgi:hypothetical protein
VGNILVVNHWPKLLSDSCGRVYRRKHSKENVGEYSDVTNPMSAACMGQMVERENTSEHLSTINDGLIIVSGYA